MRHDINVLLKILNRQVKAVDAVYYKIASKFKLSESEFWILYVLSDTGEKYSQQELSEELSISKQTVNSAVRSLLQKGYVFLENTSGSSRKKNVLITVEGEGFIKKYIEPLKTAEQKAFLKMYRSDRELYIALSQAFTANLQEEIEHFLQLYKTDK